jgi:2-keto-3-deoxy-L-fuconate dehydrogenase
VTKAWRVRSRSMSLPCTSMIRAFLPGMLAHGGGSIINMSSVASSVKGVPNRFAYCASKAAVIGLTKARSPPTSSARAFAATAICPGTVESPSLRQRIAAQARNRALMKRRSTSNSSIANPWDGWVLPEEIAQLALYLGSMRPAYYHRQHRRSSMAGEHPSATGRSEIDTCFRIYFHVSRRST